MNTVTTLLRIDSELYEEIKKIAKKQKRSINSQILFILQSYVNSVTK